MKKVLLIIALFALCISRSYAQDTSPLKIGFIIPMTGSLASFGAAIRNGVEMLREDDPESMKVFTPIYEDSQYDSKVAVGAFKKLSGVKVDAVYLFGGPMSDTLSPIADAQKIPTFSTEYDIRYTKGRTFIIRFANDAGDYEKTLLRELKKRGFHEFQIIKTENQYHNTLVHAFLSSLGSNDKAKVVFNFQPSDNDFRSAISKLNISSTDVLGIYLLPGMQNAFFRQAKELKVPHVTFFGTDSFESREENRGIEDIIEGSLYANNSVSAEFAKKYRQRSGDEVQLSQAALAYEFSRLVTDLFRDGTKPNSSIEFLNKFALTKPRSSVCGEYLFKQSPETGKHFSFPVAVREVRNGEPQIITIVPAS